MNTILKVGGYLFLALAVVSVGLYMGGYRIHVGKAGAIQRVSPGAPTGQGRGTPGWRKGPAAMGTVPGSEGQAPMGGGRRGGATANRVDPGAGEGPRSNVGGGPGRAMGPGQTGGGGPRNQTAQGQTGGPGSGMGQARGGSGSAGGQQSPRQPGFGPTGGILLPIQPGSETVPVMVNGKQSGSFAGKDLVDHVEDTVIATADGARKGWGVGKTLEYLKVQNIKEVVVTDKSGKKVTVSGNQIKDDQTFVLLTYDSKGSLLLASGPKVRGTNKGTVSHEQVVQMVSGRKDLLAFPNVIKVEVKN